MIAQLFWVFEPYLKLNVLRVDLLSRITLFIYPNGGRERSFPLLTLLRNRFLWIRRRTGKRVSLTITLLPYPRQDYTYILHDKQEPRRK